MMCCVALAVLACALPVTAQGAAPGADPDTLFLTWFGDSTTSIVAQWLEEGEPLPLAKGAADELPAFDVPKVSDVVIDGEPGDWAGRGFEVGFLAGTDGEVYTQDDLSAKALLGWDQRGLLVLVQVRDDVADESDDPESLWAADAIEFFVSTGVGSDQRYQVLIAPGADPKRSGPQRWFYDYRGDRTSGDLQAQSACAVVRGGYVVELLLPWSNLGIAPGKLADVSEAAFQFYVDDRDGQEKTKGIWWHPARDAHEQPDSMYALSLADAPGSASLARAVVQRDANKARLVVWADMALAGQAVTANSGGVEVGEATFEELVGRVLATIPIADAPDGERWGTVTAEINGQTIAFARPMKWMTVSRPGEVLVRCGILPPPVAGAIAPPPPPVLMTTSVTPFGFSGMYVQRAVFDGLEPGGEYVLSIGEEKEEATSHRFRTAPAELNEPIVFAEGGDVGVWENVAPLHKVAASWEPLFGLIGGDCAYANGRTPRRWVEFLRLWRQHMVDPEGRLIPMLCAIGNHEVDGSWGKTLNEAPFFNALFDGRFDGKSYSAVDFGDYLSILLLDSGHVSSHDGEQLAWLDKALAQRQGRPHLFTAYHVPAYPSHREFEGKYSELARRHWVPLFDKHGVDVAFEHHDHTYKRTHVMTAGKPDPDGVLYLGDGAWGMSPRTVASPQERSYLVKAISSLHVIQVTLTGETRRFIAVNEKGEVIDGYQE